MTKNAKRGFTFYNDIYGKNSQSSKNFPMNAETETSVFIRTLIFLPNTRNIQTTLGP